MARALRPVMTRSSAPIVPRNRRGVSGAVTLVVIAIVVAVLLFLVWERTRGPGEPPVDVTESGGSVVGGSGRPNTDPNGFPLGFAKAEPPPTEFKGCPAEGDGGDPELNRLKNRADEPPEYVDAPFASILALPYPQGKGKQSRRRWTDADRASIAPYEGTPVRVVGYLADARRTDPESSNCHGAATEWRDWHLWLVPAPTRDRSGSIIVETTPRVLVAHPGWTLARLRAIARDSQRVRISGWLLLDPEHPDQIGKSRGTIWEIHPIMKIEVDRAGRWVSLDDLPADPAPPRRTRRPRAPAATPAVP